MGSLTFMTMSARDQTSSASLMISAPAMEYSSSVMPEPSPAPRSTSTVWPLLRNSWTPAAVMATRNSLFLISLGTPMIIVGSRFSAG
jgi:hypothetical protein